MLGAEGGESGYRGSGLGEGGGDSSGDHVGAKSAGA